MNSKLFTSTTRLYVLLLLVGAFWIWITKAEPSSITQGGIQAPQKGFLAPDFSLPTSNGETITLSDLQGQAVLINLWASWCAPCRAEMTAIERTFQAYRSQGFQVLAVNATNQDDPNKALSFAQELGLSFPILFDREGLVSQLYQLQALPTSYFIDAQGVIQEIVVGGPMSEALLRTRAERLLDVKGAGAP